MTEEVKVPVFLIGYRGTYSARPLTYIYPPEGAEVLFHVPGTIYDVARWRICSACDQVFRAAIEGLPLRVMCCSERCAERLRSRR